MKVRLLIVLVSSLVIAPLFAGGAKESTSDSSNGVVNLKVGVYAAPERTPTQQAIISAFQQKYPNVRVSLSSADFNAYYTLLDTQVAAGDTPDVFMMSGAFFSHYAEKSVFRSLEPFITASHFNLSDYFTEEANSVWNGVTYGVPEEVDTVALAYNKTMFDNAGVAYPNKDWTWNDFLSAAEKLTTDAQGNHPGDAGFDANHIVQYGFYDPNSSQENWGNWIESNGGSFLTPDLSKAAINSPQAVQALQFLYDLMYKYKVAPTPEGVAALPGYTEKLGNPFFTGRFAMIIAGNYSLPLFLTVQKFQWDIAPLPKSPYTNQRKNLLWTQAWVMGSHTKNADVAWNFMQYWLSEPGQELFAHLRSAIPPLKSIAFSTATTPPEHYTVYLDNYATRGSFDFNPSWFQYQNAMSKSLDEMWTGATSPEVAANDAEAAANTALEASP